MGYELEADEQYESSILERNRKVNELAWKDCKENHDTRDIDFVEERKLEGEYNE